MPWPEGRRPKAKVVPFFHEVRLALLYTNPVFCSFRYDDLDEKMTLWPNLMALVTLMTLVT